MTTRYPARWRIGIVGYFILAMLAGSLCGCAGSGPTDPTGALVSPTGWFVISGPGASEEHAREADAMFEYVRVCADAPGAEPRAVSVVLHLPETGPLYSSGQAAFTCPGYTDGMVGGCISWDARTLHATLHVLDWKLGAGFTESFGHEAVHLSRRLATGDGDNPHKGPWWANGKSCQSFLEGLVRKSRQPGHLTLPARID